jgi:hypothetical protein
MVPLALLVSSVILQAIGPRHDLSVLGPLLAWGASAAQFVLAIALVWIAARESTPAGKLPRHIVTSLQSRHLWLSYLRKICSTLRLPAFL